MDPHDSVKTDWEVELGGVIGDVTRDVSIERAMDHASQLPLVADTEELLQIEGVDGTVGLANYADGFRVKLSWQKEHFPSLLLWYSNRGRKAAPWNGRHVAIGIEPVCSPFSLGPATALADNPIAQSGVATALEFSPDEAFVTRYRIEASTL